MEIDWGKIDPRIESFLIIVLLITSCFLTYLFHFILKTGIIFTHFFYIPIILAAIWWKRKGLIVPLFLASILFISDWYQPLKLYALEEDFFRSIVFFTIGIITVFLSENIEKSRLRLESSEEKFRSVIESAREAIITINKKGCILSWNKGAENIFGYKEDEVLGKEVTLIMPSHSIENFRNNFIENFNKSIKHQERMNGIRKDKTEFIMDLSGSSWESDGEKYYTAIIRDITLQEQAAETSRLLASIVENSSDAIISTDLKGNVLSWNQAAEEIYGYKNDEMIGKPISRLYAPSANGKSLIERVKDGELIKNFETKRKHANGSIIDVSLSISPLKDNDKKIYGLSIIARDITQEKAIEKALRDSEAHLKLLTNNMADVISQIDSEGKFIYASPSIKSVLGYDPKDVMGKNLWDLLHPEDIEKVRSCIKKAIDECESQSARYRFKDKDGRYIWVETKGSPLFDDEKSFLGLVCSTRDISLQKKAEDALAESERKYRSLIESARDPILTLDKSGVFEMINTAGVKLSHHNREEIIGKSISEIFPEKYEQFKQILDDVISKGEGRDLELSLPHDDNEIWLSLSIQPLIDSEGSINRVQVIAKDITEIKKIQSALEDTLEEKDILMKEIYHRVKNNLMVISSLLNLQSRYIQDEEAKEIFRESQSRAHSMAIIHERLYRSSDMKHLNFGEYINTLASDLYHTYVDSSRIKLELDVEDLKMDINTAIPLGLIVNELISNSMKHGFPNKREGKIKITFLKKDDHYLLEVKDDGIGFPEELDFRKTPSLGLQLVNSLTQQIDGDIELIKSPGTTFRIVFKEKEIL